MKKMPIFQTAILVEPPFISYFVDPDQFSDSSYGLNLLIQFHLPEPKEFTMSMCKKSVSAIVVCFSIFFYPALSFAHCDALDGPVAKDAQKALQEGSVVPVLKWIDAQHENEIKDVFIIPAIKYFTFYAA